MPSSRPFAAVTSALTTGWKTTFLPVSFVAFLAPAWARLITWRVVVPSR